MSGFRNESLLQILKIKLFALCMALIFLQIVFMVLIVRSTPFIDFLTSIPVAAFLVPGGILFLLPIAGFFGGFFNNKTILWVFSVINAIITVALVVMSILCLNTDRRKGELEFFSDQMLRYFTDHDTSYGSPSMLDAIQMSGCCGFTSPSDWALSPKGVYPNSCCGFPKPGFDRCRVEQVYKEGCLDRFKDFQNEMMACVCTYIVITFLLSVISCLIALISPATGRGTRFVYSPPTYSAQLIPVSTPIQVQMRPPLIQPMRRY